MTEDETVAVDLAINGRPVRAAAGTSVAAAMLNAGIVEFRHAVGGTWRGPVCGMGVCHECRVTINGMPHRRACIITVANGMSVSTRDPGDR